MIIDNLDDFKRHRTFFEELFRHGDEWLRVIYSKNREDLEKFCKNHINFLNKYFPFKDFKYEEHVHVVLDRHSKPHAMMFYMKSDNSPELCRNPITSFSSWINAINLLHASFDKDFNIERDVFNDYIFNRDLKSDVGPKLIESYLLPIEIMNSMGYLNDSYNLEKLRANMTKTINDMNIDKVVVEHIYSKVKTALMEHFIPISGGKVEPFSPDATIKYIHASHILCGSAEKFLKRDCFIESLKDRGSIKSADRHLRDWF